MSDNEFDSDSLEDFMASDGESSCEYSSSFEAESSDDENDATPDARGWKKISGSDADSIPRPHSPFPFYRF